MRLPLTAMRAFEATVRHKSIKKAADELNVTAAAISYQLKYLEQYLGVSLFERLPRGVAPNRTARTVQPVLSQAFETLRDELIRLKNVADECHVTVTTNSYFASLWLAPKLDQLLATNPDIRVLIDAQNVVLDVDRCDSDVVILFGDGKYRGFYVERLPDGPLSPVCSPRLHEGSRALNTLEDLRHHTLLHACWDDENDMWPTWKMWLAKAGVTSVNPDQGCYFMQGDVAVHAAMLGKGVALANVLIVCDELETGLLTRPFELSISPPPDYGFYFVSRKCIAQQPAVKRFREWMIDEMNRDRSRMAAQTQAS